MYGVMSAWLCVSVNIVWHVKCNDMQQSQVAMLNVSRSHGVESMKMVDCNYVGLCKSDVV